MCWNPLPIKPIVAPLTQSPPPLAQPSAPWALPSRTSCLAGLPPPPARPHLHRSYPTPSPPRTIDIPPSTETDVRPQINSLSRQWTLVLVNMASVMEKVDEVLLPTVYKEVGTSLGASPTVLVPLTICRALVQAACYPLKAYTSAHHDRAYVLHLGHHHPLSELPLGPSVSTISSQLFPPPVADVTGPQFHVSPMARRWHQRPTHPTQPYAKTPP